MISLSCGYALLGERGMLCDLRIIPAEIYSGMVGAQSWLCSLRYGRLNVGRNGWREMGKAVGNVYGKFQTTIFLSIARLSRMLVWEDINF